MFNRNLFRKKVKRFKVHRTVLWESTVDLTLLEDGVTTTAEFASFDVNALVLR